jgi:molybdopterin molybdotransferase
MMISFDEALDKIIDFVQPLSSEKVELIEAVGRIAAEDPNSRIDSPSADVSLKDGFAIHSEDLTSASPSSPVHLRVVGEIAAGGAWNGTVGRGEAVKVLSGARIPNGADAVVAVEFTSLNGETLKVTGDAGVGRNILVQGADLQQGDHLVTSGTRLRPASLGLLATGGYDDISVYKLPHIGILATGDEVVAPGKPLGEGQLYASNLVTLAAWCAKFGWPVDTKVVPDEASQIRDGLKSYLAKCDVLLTSGGAWKGDRDLVVHLLDDIGWQKIFHRVRIGPGKAAAFGLFEGKPIFCLPGGPPSNLMAFLQLALPGIKKLGGWTDPNHDTLDAFLARDLSGQVDWTQFIFGQLVRGEDGLSFTPLRMKSRLSEMAIANSVAAIPEGVSAIASGTSIRVQMITAA